MTRVEGFEATGSCGHFHSKLSPHQRRGDLQEPAALQRLRLGFVLICGGHKLAGMNSRWGLSYPLGSKKTCSHWLAQVWPGLCLVCSGFC